MKFLWRSWLFLQKTCPNVMVRTIGFLNSGYGIFLNMEQLCFPFYHKLYAKRGRSVEFYQKKRRVLQFLKLQRSPVSLRNDQIAERLNMSSRSVERYLSVLKDENSITVKTRRFYHSASRWSNHRMITVREGV